MLLWISQPSLNPLPTLPQPFPCPHSPPLGTSTHSANLTLFRLLGQERDILPALSCPMLQLSFSHPPAPPPSPTPQLNPHNPTSSNAHAYHLTPSPRAMPPAPSSQPKLHNLTGSCSPSPFYLKFPCPTKFSEPLLPLQFPPSQFPAKSPYLPHSFCFQPPSTLQTPPHLI